MTINDTAGRLTAVDIASARPGTETQLARAAHRLGEEAREWLGIGAHAHAADLERFVREELSAPAEPAVAILARALEAVEWTETGYQTGPLRQCPGCGCSPDDESLTGGHDGDCSLYLALIRSGWRVRKCAVCGCRDVPAEAETPLCGTCLGAAEAAGKAYVEDLRFTRADSDLAPEVESEPERYRRRSGR